MYLDMNGLAPLRERESTVALSRASESPKSGQEHQRARPGNT